jgi:predicted HAD superfamily phosphohydrolase YqeG
MKFLEGDVYITAKKLGYSYLRKIKKSNYFGLDKPAVMFDIDDTLISYSKEPLKPIIELLKKCKRDGLMIIIITARDSEYTNQTAEELAHFDIPYDRLYLRGRKDSLESFKSQIKEYISKNDDIQVLMSLGDNIMDITGDYSGYWIKLPNHEDSSLYHLSAEGEPTRVI